MLEGQFDQQLRYAVPWGTSCVRKTSRRGLVRQGSRGVALERTLESVGNVLHGLGEPGGSVLHDSSGKQYRYAPFHRFDFGFADVNDEPLVFVHEGGPKILFINPDLSLFLKLEERAPASGIWWDPRRGIDALRHRVLDDENVEIVEIRTDYLLIGARGRTPR